MGQERKFYESCSVGKHAGSVGRVTEVFPLNANVEVAAVFATS